MPRKNATDPRAEALAAAAPAKAKADAPAFLPDVPEWKQHCPTLNAFFTVTELDGAKRKLPTLTIWVEDHGIKAVMADREHKRKIWFTVASLVELWDAAEAALRDPNAKWMDETGSRRKTS